MCVLQTCYVISDLPCIGYPIEITLSIHSSAFSMAHDNLGFHVKIFMHKYFDLISWGRSLPFFRFIGFVVTELWDLEFFNISKILALFIADDNFPGKVFINFICNTCIRHRKTLFYLRFISFVNCGYKYSNMEEDVLVESHDTMLWTPFKDCHYSFHSCLLQRIRWGEGYFWIKKS